MEWLAPSLVVAVLLVASAFLSASETALFSLDPRWLRANPRRRGLADRVQAVKSRPAALLTTILLGNEIVNIAISALLATWVIDRLHGPAKFLGVVAVTLLLLVFGDVTPKSLAIQFPERVAWLSVRVLPAFGFLLAPFRHLLTLIAGVFSSSEGSVRKIAPAKEIETLLAHGERIGVIDSGEREMASRFFDLLDSRVSESMVPRTDMLAIEADTPFADAVSLLRRSTYSRIPVYEESLDRIVGILSVRDVVRAHGGADEAPRTIRPLVTGALFVPETKRVIDLFHQMRRERIPLAVVVDEHGGTAGIIGLEDIVEEIFGEEEGAAEGSLWRTLRDGSILVDGRMNVGEFAGRLRLPPPREEVDTVGGLVFSLAGRLPRPGERFTWRGVSLHVIRLRNLSVGQVRVFPVKGKP